MNKRISMLLALSALLGFNQQAHAAGFALIEQSVSEMGAAYAGGAAIAEDATTIFFNPAGLTRLCGNQAVIGAHGVFPEARFHNDGSMLNPVSNLVYELTAPAFPDFPIPSLTLNGGDGGNAGMNALVGNGYYSHQVNDCLWLGLALTSPFGLSTSYDDDWVGRYQALHSALLTVDINPVFAYKVNKCWSIGGGFRALYAHAKLTSMVDYGSIAAAASLLTGPDLDVVGALETEGFLPQTQDGHVQIKGNAWGWGGNFGVLYEPYCGTRLGFNWRSQVRLHIHGREKFDRLPALIADPALARGMEAFFAAIAAAAATDTGAKTKITLPDIFQVSGYHEFNNCWAIMGDITWTRWHVLNKVNFKFKNPNQADQSLTFNWKSVFRYAVGATYRPHCDLILRIGTAFDQTPVRNKTFRNPRLPDQSRIWATIGAGYDWSRCLHFDIGYAHLFLRHAKIDQLDHPLPEDLFKGELKGHWKEQINIISLQAVYNF